MTEIEQFNAAFGTRFETDQADTVGGLLSCHLARVPRRGEVVLMDTIRFEVLRADARQVQLLKVQVTTPSDVSSAEHSSDVETTSPKAANL